MRGTPFFAFAAFAPDAGFALGGYRFPGAASRRLALRFPQLTPADNQLCLLIRLGFSNAQIAAFTAVSSSSVSQQKFRLKKRMIQAEEGLFAEGETLEMIVGNIPTKSR